MKESVKYFIVPLDLREHLKKYVRFRLKRFIQTAENDFYVGTEMSFGYIDKEVNHFGYHKGLDMHINGDVENINFSSRTEPMYRGLRSTYKTLADFEKDFEPIVIEKEKFKFKAKLFNMEIIIK